MRSEAVFEQMSEKGRGKEVNSKQKNMHKKTISNTYFGLLLYVPVTFRMPCFIIIAVSN